MSIDHAFATLSSLHEPAPLDRSSLLVRVLDEVGWGVLILDDGHTLTYANPVARRAFGRAIALAGGRLAACRDEDQEPLSRALARARGGLRTMLPLARGDAATMAAIVPLRGVDPEDTDGRGVMVLLSRQAQADPVVIQLFACSHALTEAEGRVLALLCNGTCPNDIASELGVAISTIRTQLGAIRAKTRTASLRELAHRIAALPPMTSLPGIGAWRP